jgi:polyhydroxyalkanoate synthesis regulator protein
MLRIRKSSKRRLYDYSTNRYITLRDIEVMIGLGDRIQVIRHDGVDVTDEILCEVLRHQVSAIATPHSVRDALIELIKEGLRDDR